MTAEPAITVKLGYSVGEAAQAVGIGRSLMYELIASNEIRSVKVGARRIVPAEALREYLADLMERQGAEHAEAG